ncbi:MAG: metal-dependent transcriptional regulator [Chloroflexi bacterium]|nr:MAG: metal-dependent transcriptional regulator [Chloroflexota bacterium]
MRLTPSKEDYLKAIFVLSQTGKSVRIRDLASHLNVKPPSVVGAVKQLMQDGLVYHEYYGHIELTEKGLEIAREIYNRHEALCEFLRYFLGLDSKAAAGEACRLEHNLSPQTMERIIKFLQFLKTCPASMPRCLAAFHHYAATNSLPDSCLKTDESSSAGDSWWKCSCGALTK